MKKPLTKEESKPLDDALVDYIVADARPLSTVNSYYFQRLMFKANPRYKVPCVQTTAKIIGFHYCDFKKDIIATTSKVDVVCLTTDMWSSNHRAFIGVTLHWLNEISLLRRSEAIEIRRFKGCIPFKQLAVSYLISILSILGSHTYDKIAEKLKCVMQDFGIEGKVQNIVTDNGLNVVKAAREYFNSKAVKDSQGVITNTITEPESELIMESDSGIFILVLSIYPYLLKTFLL